MRDDLVRIAKEAPALLPAWFVAESFYKFHSFTLELLAFGATWFVLRTVLRTARGWLGQPAIREAADGANPVG